MDTLNSEIKKVEDQLQDANQKIKAMSGPDITNRPRAEDLAPQTELSKKEIKKTSDNYLVPVRRVGSAQKFNERFRKDWEYDKEYVQFIAENVEVGGDAIEIWTRPYGGVDAEFWRVPVNKPVWGPRYLAENISKRAYRKLIMDDNAATGTDSFGSYRGQLVVEKTVHRFTARPAIENRKSIFGAGSF